MKILSNVTMAGNVSMASNAQDQFTIGSELERDNANADEFKVWANANFYNDVTLGSSSVDIVEVKGQLTASQGIKINDLKIQTSEDFLRSSNGTAATGSFLTSSTYDAEIFIGTNEGTNTVSLYAQSLRMQGELEAYINAPTIALNGPLTASSGIDTQFISASGISTFETAQFNNVVITAGNIDGTVIGDNQQSSGHFTALTSSTGFNTNVLILSGSHLETAWSSYTPTWTAQAGTQPSLGNGTLTGYYKQIGKTVFVRIKFTAGSTTTFGDNTSIAWQFSLPVSASDSYAIQLPCSMLDNGVNWYNGVLNGGYSGATSKSAIISSVTTGHHSTAVTFDTPFNWGNGDNLAINGSYEAA